MKVNININGVETEITLTEEQLKQVKSSNPLDEVFKYHNTTQEAFDSLYKNIPKHVKAYELECMVVASYNKGWIPNFNDTSEYKWYAWLYLDTFRLYTVNCYHSASGCSARVLFKNKKDLLEAVEKFENVFRESRMFNN